MNKKQKGIVYIMKKAIGKSIGGILAIIVLVGIGNSLVVTEENEYKL